MPNFFNFINTFNLTLKNSIKNNSFEEFFNEISTLDMSFAYDFEEIESKLIEYKNVLDKITSIIYKPHIKVSTNPIILRSETAPSLTPSSFLDTVKDTKLWKLKNDKYTPEYVHSFENIDVIDNYENRFIATLISLIADQFEILKNSISFINNSFEEHYFTKTTNFTKYGLYQNYKLFDYPYDTFFNEKHDNIDNLINKINKLNKKIKSIKGTEFYKVNSKIRLDNQNIIPTNVLIHDELYNYCFKFYKTNFKEKNIDKDLLSNFYFNYFVTSFLDYLKNKKLKINFKKSLINLDQNLMLNFSNLKFKKDLLSFEISRSKDLINGIEVEVVVKELDIKAKYLLVIKEVLNELNDLSLDIYKNYDSVIFITMNNLIKKYQNVINYSPFDKNLNKDDVLDNLFKSFSLVYKVSSESYIKKCPICGEESINKNKDNYECLKCGAKYSLFNINKENLMWIKSIRRKG